MTAREPRTEVSEEYVDPVAVTGLGALLDEPVTGLDHGDPLPPLWHRVALPRRPGSSSIGPDGHPVRGGILLSVPDITIGTVGSGSAPESTVHAELTAEFPTPGEPHA